MKGIREAAMSQEDEEPKTEYEQSSFGDYDNERYDGHYNSVPDYGYGQRGFDPIPKWPTYPSAKEIKADFTILLNVTCKEIGKVADGMSKEYNWEKAEKRANEIAYDRIEGLLGKEYTSKYSVTFEAMPSMSYEDYDVEAKLTKLKK